MVESETDLSRRTFATTVSAVMAAMTRIAIQEKLNGKAVDWMEKVTGGESASNSNTNRNRR